MAGRPPIEDSRNKQYRVRLNNEEDDMLAFCSQETGEAKSEIFRKALKAYYENAKYVKNALRDRSEIPLVDEKDTDAYENYEYTGYDLDHISLQRTIKCPGCGAEINMDFEDESETFSEERQMGPEVTYSFDLEDCICDNCDKHFRVYGYISEYPMGAYNYEDINVEEV